MLVGWSSPNHFIPIDRENKRGTSKGSSKNEEEEAGYRKKQRISNDGSKLRVLSRIPQAIAARTKLKPIWRDSNISFGSQVNLMLSLHFHIFI